MAAPDKPTPPYPDTPRWTATLRDHSQVLIRPMQPQDSPAERAFVEGLGLQTHRIRLGGRPATQSEALIDDVADGAFEHDAAFAATVPIDSRERIVGLARFSIDREGAGCKFAVMVAEDWRDRGLGTTLLRHLIDIGRERGIRTMTSVNSVEDTAMHDLARGLGFSSQIDPDNPDQWLHSLTL